MNGILIATRTGVAPAFALPGPPIRSRAPVIPGAAVGSSAANRAIHALSMLLRRAFRPIQSSLRVAAGTGVDARTTNAAAGPSPVLRNGDDKDVLQDWATAEQDPDIAPTRHARRLSAIASTPSATAINETAMSAIATRSNLRKPPAADRAVAGARWLDALSRLWRGSAGAATEVPEVRFALPPRTLSSLGFREFTAPRRLQGGGALRLRTKAAGQIAAVAGLRLARGRQR